VSDVAVPAAFCAAIASGALVRTVLPVVPQASARIRPYTATARSQLGLAPDPVAVHASGASGLLGVLLAPLYGAARRLGAVVESRSDEAIALRLYQAGRADVTVADHRVAQVARGARFAVLFAAAGIVFVHTPVIVLALAVVGFAAGAARARGELDRAIAHRIARMELELGTVNHLLAMHVRSGSGVVQAVHRIVDRGHGAMVADLAATLTAIRSGEREAQAFRRAADLTPCRDAARTYLLIATSVERGTDLAAALLAVADDLRDARRDAMRRAAVKRRAGMLAPTIGVLAPIMLLFVAAPLPSIVLGNR
jgi:Flp pilus assembly protein TadB